MTQLMFDPAALMETPEEVMLAVDTEFHAERRYTPSLLLIQICAPNQEPWLIDPHDRDLMATVGPKLKRHPWLVHAGHFDLILLNRALGGVPERVWDTQIAAGLVDTVYPAGLAKLLHQHLGQDLDKSQGLSDWTRRPLTPEQLAYAAGDVATLHALWEALIDRHPEREALIHTASAEARTEALRDPADLDPWRRIQGHQRLPPQQLTVLKALAQWRDGVARGADQPPGSVLNNGLLLQLAKRCPTDLDSLLVGRRSPKKVLTRVADNVLPVIRAALESPVGPRQTITPASADAAHLAWLVAATQIAAQQQDWAARLVAPEAVLTDWVLGIEPEGWRAQILLPLIASATTSGLARPNQDRA